MSAMTLTTVEENIFKLLGDEGSTTIVLVGKTGSGKTWTARKLSALATKKSLFDFIIWVFLNKKYDTRALYNSIANQLSLFLTTREYEADDNMDFEEVKEEEDLEVLKKKISDALIKKIFLLVLDDEGNKMKEGEIKDMLPLPLQNSCKVLMTTVNEDGGHNDHETKTVINVGSLSKEESISLLRESVGSEDFELPGVNPLAEAFVGRGMDQPGEIIVAAKALSYFCKCSSGVRIMESALKKALNDEKPNSIQLLSNAHDMLPNSILVDFGWRGRHFFRDRGNVHYNELIAYWIMEGYLGRIDSVEKAYEEGHRVLMDLIDCQFLKMVEGNHIIMEKAAEADYIVQERAMLRLDDCHRSGFDGITELGLASLFEDDKWGGLGRITQADGMIRMPKKGQKLLLAMLDGNGMCREVLDNFFQSNPQLQVLAIFNPTLESLPPVLSCMENLDILVLRGCDFLVDIEHIRELSKLTILEISGASSLIEIPDDIFAKMTQLQSLHLSSLQITKLPNSFYQLTKLHRLLLKDCPNLNELKRFAECHNLVVLNLSGAMALKELPYRSLEEMQKLRTLDLSRTNIRNIPKFGKIEYLTHISLRDCPLADRLPSIASLTRLKVLDISGSTQFVEIQDDSFETNAVLDILDLSGTRISELPSNSIANPRHLYLKGCSSLENLPFMESLKNLEALDLSGASIITIEEKFFKFLGELRFLNLSGTNIESLPYLPNDAKLRQLLLSHCSSLQKLPQLKNLTKLEVLDLSGCNHLKDIKTESFDHMTFLQRLILSETQIEDLPSLSNLINLRGLFLSKCSKLKVFPSLESLSKLEELNLCGISCLVECGPDFLENNRHLRILDLSETNLKKLPSMSKLENLSQLLLRGCKHLEEMPDLKELTKLEVLDLSGTVISQLPSLNNYAKLHQVLLRDCPNLDGFLRLNLPNMVNNLAAESRRVNCGEKEEEEELNQYQCHIPTLPEMVTDSNRLSISVSGSTFYKLLEKNDFLGETRLKQCHLSVRPVNKQKSGSTHCDRDIRGIYCQPRYFSYFNEQGRSLEICGYEDLPNGIEDVLICAEYVFLFDNAFIKNLDDLGAKNVKLMRGCWIERCGNMESVFHAKEVGDTAELGAKLEMLWLSNLRNLTSIYGGNLQHDGFGNLKQVYLDCCPKLLSVFSSSQQPVNLEILHIKFCDNLEGLFDQKSGQCTLPKVHTLHLWELPKLKRIGWVTPNMHTLIVGQCPMLVNVFSQPHLPENLTILHIRDCDQLDTVIENSTSVDYELPKLKTLHLLRLPKLRSIGGGLPSLRNPKIRDCPNYKDSMS